MVIEYKIQTDDGKIVQGSKQINPVQLKTLEKIFNIQLSDTPAKVKDPRQWDLEDMIKDIEHGSSRNHKTKR